MNLYLSFHHLWLWILATALCKASFLSPSHDLQRPRHPLHQAAAMQFGWTSWLSLLPHPLCLSHCAPAPLQAPAQTEASLKQQRPTGQTSGKQMGEAAPRVMQRRKQTPHVAGGAHPAAQSLLSS